MTIMDSMTDEELDTENTTKMMADQRVLILLFDLFLDPYTLNPDPYTPELNPQPLI